MEKTISFYGTCAARSRVTLVSKRIGHAYRVVEIAASFPGGCQNLLQHSYHVSLDNNAPTSSRPSDVSLLAENGQVDYIVGEAERKVLRHGVEVSDSGTYLKVHGFNSDYYAHAVDVQITLEVT